MKKLTKKLEETEEEMGEEIHDEIEEEAEGPLSMTSLIFDSSTTDLYSFG